MIAINKHFEQETMVAESIDGIEIGIVAVPTTTEVVAVPVPEECRDIVPIIMGSNATICLAEDEPPICWEDSLAEERDLIRNVPFSRYLAQKSSALFADMASWVDNPEGKEELESYASAMSGFSKDGPVLYFTLCPFMLRLLTMNGESLMEGESYSRTFEISLQLYLHEYAYQRWWMCRANEDKKVLDSYAG